MTGGHHGFLQLQPGLSQLPHTSEPPSPLVSLANYLYSSWESCHLIVFLVGVLPVNYSSWKSCYLTIPHESPAT